VLWKALVPLTEMDYDFIVTHFLLTGDFEVGYKQYGFLNGTVDKFSTQDKRRKSQALVSNMPFRRKSNQNSPLTPFARRGESVRLVRAEEKENRNTGCKTIKPHL